jgi:ribosomal protein S27AE
MMVRDLTIVQKQLGFTYEIDSESGVAHYQQVCPRCRRALFGLAQAAQWERHLTQRIAEKSPGNQQTR